MARIAIVHTEADASLAEALAAKLQGAGHEVQPEAPDAALALVLATPAFENDATEQARAAAIAGAAGRLVVLDLGARPNLLPPAPCIGWDLEGLDGFLNAPLALEPLRLRVRYLADKLRRASGEEHPPRPDASLQRLMFLERYLSARLAVIDTELSAPLPPKRIIEGEEAGAKSTAQPLVQVLAPPQVRPGRTFQALISVALPTRTAPVKSRRKVRVLLETARSGPSGAMQQRASGRDGETLRFTFRLRAGLGQPGRSLLRVRLECDGRRIGEVSWPLDITPDAPLKPAPEAQGAFKAYSPV